MHKCFECKCTEGIEIFWLTGRYYCEKHHPLKKFVPCSASETRPKNIGVAFCSDIKTKAIYQIIY